MEGQNEMLGVHLPTIIAALESMNDVRKNAVDRNVQHISALLYIFEIHCRKQNLKVWPRFHAIIPTIIF